MTIALIDGDIAAYRASAATQRSLRWDDDDAPSVYANPGEAAKAAVETVRLWTDAVGASRPIVCLTGSGNFRKSVFPAYKANRADVPKPIALKHVREVLADHFQVEMVDGLEADDLIGLALTSPKLRGKVIAVSTDKDLRTVPGMHFNPSKDREPVFVMEAEANHTWFMQALTGDASDGYPGCRKIGPVKAAKVLGDWDGSDMAEGWRLVSWSFFEVEPRTDVDLERLDRSQAQALSMLRVSRILRHGDYNKKTREVTLWHPVKPETLKLSA